MRKSIVIICLFWSIASQAQNKQILYGFDNIPQGLLLNPGIETSYKYHIGVPMISGASVNVNTSGITIADVFRDDSVSFFSGTDFNTKIANALDKIDNDDYASLNMQIEVLSVGYKLNNRDYISAGFYTEADAFITYPKDVFRLINEGNAPYIGENFSIANPMVKAEVVGVLHAGISRRINHELTLGARVKIYSGSLNVTSTDNTGTFSTELGEDGIYTNYLNNINATVNSSGIYNADNETDLSVGEVFGNTFFGGNLGFGFDIGMTYHYNEQIEFTASLLDIGYINYSKDIRNATVKGNYAYSGINFLYDGSSNYWQDIGDDFDENVEREENNDSYSVIRPIKFNSSFRYSFGKSRYESNCHDIRLKDYYDNAVGAQLYSVLRPNGLRWAFTGFYERKFTKFLNTKVTYTIDDFSATNIGLGMSANFWKLNVYGMLDNIFAVDDVANAHTASLQFGVNFIFN